MKTLVVYDSIYGNTEKIARAIGGAIEGEVKVLKADEAYFIELQGFDLIFVGAPTQAGRPSMAADLTRPGRAGYVRWTRGSTIRRK